MRKLVVLAPGAIAAGTKIPVPAPILEGKKITKVHYAVIARLTEGTPNTFTATDVTSEASVHADGDGIVLSSTDTTASDLLILVIEVDYEPGVTA